MAYNDTYQDSQASNNNTVNGVTVTTTTYTRKYIRTTINIVPEPAHIIDHTYVDASGISQSDLDAARSLDILFGHQSVGLNIISGLGDLATDNPTRYSVDITFNPSTDWFDSNNGVGHFSAGDNGDPQSKMDEFEAYVDTNGYASHIRVAVIKFCFADLWPMTAITGSQAWEIYRPAMASLISSFPGVYFVWVTDPLYANTNDERHAFNELMRAYIDSNGGWLLDLADIECHDPSGNYITDGTYPILYSGYTTDGGHLNDVGNIGRDRVANAWWCLMSAIAKA